MASLTSTLTRKQVAPHEDNLDKGVLYTFSASHFVNFTCGFYWQSPGCGKAIIEMWGAGGSGARMCCCGTGIPGNNGAYVLKTICTNPNTYVNGNVGQSCSNANDIYYRGRSNPSGVCWNCGCDACCLTNGCLCAEGGFGGASPCTTAAYTPYCCLRSTGFCGSQTSLHGAGCGIICNYGSGVSWCGVIPRDFANAHCGDLNCKGCFSCTNFMHCDGNMVQNCYAQVTIPIPGGMFAQGPSFLCFKIGNGTDDAANHSGQGLNNFIYALNAASRFPSQGQGHHSCWTGNTMCGCYENDGCLPFVPYGFGGMPASNCPDVRSHGYRGGLGAVRIKYVCSASCFYDV